MYLKVFEAPHLWTLHKASMPLTFRHDRPSRSLQQDGMCLISKLSSLGKALVREQKLGDSVI